MSRSASSHISIPRLYCHHGFTLIELLVVMVLIALFSGMVVLSIGDNLQRKLLSEAERLQSIIVAAADEAIYTTNEYGIYLDKSGYQILRWEGLTRQWVTTNSQAFAPYILPAGIVIEWRVDGFMPPDDSEALKLEFGQEFNADSNSNAAADEDSSLAEMESLAIPANVKPQLLMLSSSELSVFEIDFKAEENNAAGTLVRLSSDGFSLPSVRNIDGSVRENAR